MSTLWPTTTQQRVRFSLLVILATVSAFWYMQYRSSDHLPPLPNKQGAEGIMRAITIDEFDQSGNLLSQLKAESAYQLPSNAQHPKNHATMFQYPYLDIYTVDQQHWKIHSKWGEIDKKEGAISSKIYLKGGVQLTQMAKASPITRQNVITKIDTSYLEIDPKSKQATTDAAVTIQQNTQKISGHGLFADLNSGKIRLYSNVRGHFEQIGQ